MQVTSLQRTTGPHERPSGRPPLVVADGQRRSLWRYLRTLGADPDDADDLVQEAVLILLRRADDVDAGAPTFAFLRTTARQLWWRSQKRRVSERELHEADAIWDARCGDDGGEHYVDALRACLEQLPPRSRRLLHATYVEDRGRADAGRVLGIGSNGVKSALRRLRAFLHTCIRTRLST